MTNLEFYKDEIHKICRSIDNCSIDVVSSELADAAVEVWVKYSDKKLDLINWLLEEYKEPLLNDDEKEYLYQLEKILNIKIISIYKCRSCWTEELTINYTSEIETDGITLPKFKIDEKFINLQFNKSYTREELEL